ncbi:tetratricopeptide repeat protein [Cystobacter fuscus]
MKQGKILALVGVLVVAPMALAQGSGGSPKPSAGKTAARALEVYEQGKRLYDAKNYAGALERFDQAAAIEPDKARWQYNRGLALRKLGRFAEAREALLHSRTLDPAYKQAEIDDKLREMGFSPAPPPSAPASEPPAPSVDAPASEPPAPSISTPPAPPPEPSVVPRGETSKKPANPMSSFCVCSGMALLFFLLMRWQLSKTKPLQDPHRASTSTLQPRSEEFAPLEERLEQVAASLVQVEHALRLNEDADLRALLNQATMAEQNARQSMADFRKGTSSRSAVTRRIDKAHEAAKAAVAHAHGLFGDKAFLPEGQRVGCYFCARPWPTRPSGCRCPSSGALRSRTCSRVPRARTWPRRASLLREGAAVELWPDPALERGARVRSLYPSSPAPSGHEHDARLAVHAGAFTRRGGGDGRGKRARDGTGGLRGEPVAGSRQRERGGGGPGRDPGRDPGGGEEGQ